MKLTGYYKLEQSNYALLNQLMKRYLSNIDNRSIRKKYTLYLKEIGIYLNKNMAELHVPIYDSKINLDGKDFDFKEAPMEFTILNFIHIYLEDNDVNDFQQYLNDNTAD